MARYKKGDACKQRAPKKDGEPPTPPQPVPPWPADLDFDRARRILFPDDPGSDDFPRMSWRAGKKPARKDEKEPFPLDDRISELKNNKAKKIRILYNDELAKIGISCPYYEARLGVLQAVKHATAAKGRAQRAKARKRDLDILKKRSDFRFAKIESRLKAFKSALAAKHEQAKEFHNAARDYLFGAAHEGLYIPGLWRYHLAPWSDIENAHEILTSSIAQLHRHEERNSRALDDLIARQYDPAPVNKKIEAHIFVQYLGFVWFDLTGRSPVKTASGPFIDFVSSAWNSLAYEDFDMHPEEYPSWNSVCREAIKSFEERQKGSRLLSWDRSTLGLLPKYRILGLEPSSAGPEASSENDLREDISTDDDALCGKAPFDAALLFGRLSTIAPSKPNPEFLRLEKLMDAGELSSSALTKEEVILFLKERERRAPSNTLPDPRALTPLELRRREIWRAEALDEWRRIANNFELASSVTLDAVTKIASAAKNWRGPAIRRFAETLSETEAQRFRVTKAKQQMAGNESLAKELGLTDECERQKENWLKPKSISASL